MFMEACALHVRSCVNRRIDAVNMIATMTGICFRGLRLQERRPMVVGHLLVSEEDIIQ